MTHRQIFWRLVRSLGVAALVFLGIATFGSKSTRQNSNSIVISLSSEEQKKSFVTQVEKYFEEQNFKNTRDSIPDFLNDSVAIMNEQNTPSIWLSSEKLGYALWIREVGKNELYICFFAKITASPLFIAQKLKKAKHANQHFFNELQSIKKSIQLKVVGLEPIGG